MDITTFPHQVSIADSEAPALYADISDAEFYAIGKMTTSWAILEHSMMATTRRLASEVEPRSGGRPLARSVVGQMVSWMLPARRPVTLRKNFVTMPFEDRFRIFQRLVKKLPAGRRRIGFASF